MGAACMRTIKFVCLFVCLLLNDADGIVNMYHANMLKLYVDRQNVTPHCLMSAESNVTADEQVESEEFSLEECA